MQYWAIFGISLVELSDGALHQSQVLNTQIILYNYFMQSVYEKDISV